MQPSVEFLDVAKIMETLSLVYHAAEIQKDPGIIKHLVNMIKSNADCTGFEDEVLTCLVRTRTYIRVRELNKVTLKENLRQRDLKI